MTPRHAAATTLLVLLTLLGPACADMGPTQDRFHDEIALHRARWEAHRPSSYVYEMQRICFCAEGAQGPVRIRVQGTQIVERTYTSSGAPVASEFQSLFPSVDGLFDMLDEAVDRDPYEFTVRWHDEIGVPLEFYVDYDARVFDDELGVKVLALPSDGGGA